MSRWDMVSVGVKVGQGVGWCEGGTGCRLV